MSDDGDEFDAEAAAARATGTEPSSERSSESGTDDVEADSDEGSDLSGASGAAAIFVPLLLADEAGPTVHTFREHGMSEGVGLVLDGLADYILSFADVEMGDNLGPAGKMGLGVSRLLPDEVDDEEAETGADETDDLPDMGGADGI